MIAPNAPSNALYNSSAVILISTFSPASVFHSNLATTSLFAELSNINYLNTEHFKNLKFENDKAILHDAREHLIKNGLISAEEV